ncbi:MAG: ABC transporter permease [Actinobacteria bacterium]|nr:ABC transporter permease [Actinomycetota bacterium]
MIDELSTFFRETPDVGAIVLRHLQLSFVPVVAALAVALPVGLFIGHARRFEFITVTLANLGRAIPSFAILSLALIPVIRLEIEDFGFWTTFVALFFLSLPPIVVNTYTGVKNVDEDLLEAARGQGLSGAQVLRSVEVPLAAPLIVGGIRTAAVQSVATATLGALVAAGGLGDPIVFGFRASDDPSLIGGAFLVALLAIGSEAVFAVIQRVVRPRGASRDTTMRPIQDLADVRRPVESSPAA